MADRRRPVLLGISLAVAGVTATGCLIDGDAPGAAVTDPWLPTGTAAVSPPPADPEDVATDTATPSAAALVITYSEADAAGDAVMVGAYVAGLIEDGGRCTMTLTLDGASVSTGTDGVADVGTTSCGQMSAPLAELSPGTWTVDVTYSSPTGSSVAPARATVDVP